MPENEFDKQVKKMMDDLKLRPSEAVWPGVEKRIREKKRRRRAFILLPLFAGLMLLGYSGIHYFNSKTDDKKLIINSKDETKKQDDNKVSIPVSPTNAEKKNQVGIIEGSTKQETTVIEEAISPKNRIRKVSELDKIPNNKNFIPSNTKTPEISPTLALKDDKKSQAIPGYEDKRGKNENPATTGSIQENENIIVATIDTITSNVENDSNLVNEVTIIKSDSNFLKELPSMKSINDSAASKKLQQEKRLAWGFHVSTGVSGTRSKFFQLNQNKLLESRSSPNASTGNTSYGVPVPNSNKTGIAFKVGALVEKRFSNRSSFDFGLQYSYYSDQIKVGYRSDSVIRIQNYYTADLFVSGFYSNTSINNYTNRYHFIELPLNYHLHLINGKQNSFSWDFGISVGQLLSTNSLVFDTANRGVYFADKKLIRKINTSLSTGFSITFNKHKPIQYIIGPQFQLGLINLNKNYGNKKAYPFFAGVDLRVMMPKK